MEVHVSQSLPQKNAAAPMNASGVHEQVLSDGTFVRSRGQGQAVVFIHGLGLDHSIWENQFSFFDQKQIVVYDLLGHGRSHKPEIDHTVELYVAQLERLLDELRIDRATIVGFSLGGLIVRAFALRHPERLAALGIMNTWFQRTPYESSLVVNRMASVAQSGPSASVTPAIHRWFTEPFRTRRPDVVEQISEMIEANDHASYLSAYRVAAEQGAAGEIGLENIKCPTMVMTCAEDRGNSPGMAMRMSEIIENSELVVLPGLRHMALMEDPESVNKALQRLFERAA